MGLGIRIGDAVIGIASNDAAFLADARVRWSHFLSDVPAGVTLTLDFDDAMPKADVLQAIFRLHDGASASTPDLSQWLRIDDMGITVRLPRSIAALDAAFRPRAINVLLCGAYNEWVHRHAGGAHQIALLHASAVRHGEGAVLFTGPSGAGKTTCARLAGERPVLHDEIVALRIDGPRVTAAPTPLLGELPAGDPRPVPVLAVHWLRQAPVDAWQRLTPAQAFPLVFTQLLATSPCHADRAAQREGVATRAALAARVVESVPVAELSFTKSEAFWRTIADHVPEAAP